LASPGPIYLDPATMVPGGNPVMETPGLLSATFPMTSVGPALVTVELPKTATFSASPSEIICWAAADREIASRTKAINAAAHAVADLRAWFFPAEGFCIPQMEQRECATWVRRVRNLAGEHY
jgi:hypothetical protein